MLAPPRRYVSRGGDKLAGAVQRFSIDVAGRRVLDAGASTGGFTDCLLQHGAASAIAVDVGYGQIHERLRNDDRVTVLERTNARTLAPSDLPPPPPDLLVADLSFISLRLVLPAVLAVLAQPADALVLVKPQFEAQRADVGKGGVVRDPGVWRTAVSAVAEAFRELGWSPVDVMPSLVPGPAGNIEFLLHARSGAREGDASLGSISERIERALTEAIDVRGGDA